MCEIKFRVWDNIVKKYIDSRYVSISGLGLLHVAKRIIKNCFRPLHTRKNPWFIVEQYTGLKDINGTEIYEGDIVSLRLWGSNGYEYENGIVRYYPPSAAFKWFSLEDDKNDCNNYWLQHADSDGREVVGNIHENPELVEEKE